MLLEVAQASQARGQALDSAAPSGWRTYRTDEGTETEGRRRDDQRDQRDQSSQSEAR